MRMAGVDKKETQRQVKEANRKQSNEEAELKRQKPMEKRYRRKKMEEDGSSCRIRYSLNRLRIPRIMRMGLTGHSVSLTESGYKSSNRLQDWWNTFSGRG